jgi:hypothetical protein
MSDPAEILAQGAELHKQGRLDQALALYQRVLGLDPSNAFAMHLVGVVAHQKGLSAEAITFIGRAIALEPGPAADRAIAVSQEVAVLWLDRGGALRDRGNPGDLEAALRSIETAVALEPETVRGQLELGATQRLLGRLEAAETAFRGAVALNPTHLEGAGRLGLLLQQMGRSAEALEVFTHPVRLRHGSAWWGDVEASDQHLAGEFLSRHTTFEKLRHDFEQLQWLESKGLLPPDLIGVGQVYAQVLEEVKAVHLSRDHAIALSEDQFHRLWATHLRVLVQHGGEAVEGSPLHPDLDLAAIQHEWAAQKYPVLVIDGLLRADALESLLRFCRASTVWFDYKYRNGYLGARMQRGFACPLLLQVAAQLSSSLPRIFGGHPLQQLWGYKYHQSPEGIGVHADAAAVNLNMWITPDAANLNPETGGLVVYREPAPLDWDFHSYNRDQERMRAWLAAHQHTELRVPHRQNRAVLFHSNLFHQTDVLHFRPGYENRRINITMLYGDRMNVD